MLNSHSREIPGATAAPAAGLVARNIKVDSHRTSIRLEQSMWEALRELCQREQASMNELCSFVAASKSPALTLTAALRVLIASYFRSAATEEGHRLAGHGRAALKAYAPLLALLQGNRWRPPPS